MSSTDAGWIGDDKHCIRAHQPYQHQQRAHVQREPG